MIMQKKIIGESSASIVVCGLNGRLLLLEQCAIIANMNCKGFTMEKKCGSALMRKGESKQLIEEW